MDGCEVSVFEVLEIIQEVEVLPEVEMEEA